MGSDGFVLNREMVFKIKPSDCDQSHAPAFDFVLQAKVLLFQLVPQLSSLPFILKVLEALSKLHARAVVPSEEALRRELDMGEREWTRFGKDTLELIEGIRNPLEAQESRPLPSVS